MTSTQYQHLFLRKKRSGVAFLFFDSPGKHNFLTEEVLLELRDALERVKADSEITTLILISGKGDAFIAGASLRQISRFKSYSEAHELSLLGQTIFQRLEDLPIATIAAINGVCVGGGLELSLSCKFRIATNHAHTRLGLPEVNYGLIPGWGGTQRLPRTVGVDKSLEMILLGQVVNASYAFKLGLLDMVVDRDDLVNESEKFANDLRARNLADESARRKRQTALEEKSERAFALWRRTLKLRLREQHYPAPFAALDAIQVGVTEDANAGFELEAEKFAALSQTEISRNLIDAFFVKELAKQQAAKLAAPAPNSVSVNLIAPTSQLTEYLKARKIELAPLEEADLVLDCNVEQNSANSQRLNAMQKLMKPSAVLVLNNSVSRTNGRSVLGMQFFEPLDKTQIIEIQTPEALTKHSLGIAARFAQHLHKIPIIVPDSPGHLINRICSLYFLQAVRLAERGTPIEHIELAAREFGMPSPPFAVIDLIGLNQAKTIVENLFLHFGSRFAIPQTLEKALKAGLYGRTTGKGFYLWTDGKRAQLNPKVESHLDFACDRSRPSNEALEKIADKMILPMVDEAARCLDEKLMRRPREIDLAINVAINFPPFRGGLLKYADKRGIDKVIVQLDEIYQQTAPPTPVSDYLMRLRERNRKFYSKE